MPIAGTPSISFPLTESRKSGVLAPTFSTTTNTGLQVTVPYYWDIAPNRDLTLYPHYISRRGLMLGGDAPKIGAPLVKGASVQCEILEHGQGEKVIAFKKKRRKNTHRKRGHRQHFTKVKVLGITAG